MKILVLEDDKVLGNAICTALNNYNVTLSLTYDDAMVKFKAENYDLLLLDINLKNKSGFDFLEEIRKTNKVKAIFISANDREVDILKGFDIGCDDYITKPFSLSVLKAKVKLLEKDNISKGVAIGDLKINFDKMKVFKSGEEVILSSTEFKLLKYLYDNRNIVVTKEQILEYVWDVDMNFVVENTVNVTINRLRKKIEDNAKEPKYILTVFGIGYTLESNI